MTAWPAPVILPDEVASCKRGKLLNYKHGLVLNWLEEERVCLFWRKTWWEAKIHDVHPLMWWDERLKRYCMPDRHEARTDLGSTPVWMQGIFPATEMPWAYYPHDSGYRWGGMWTAVTLDGEWTFTRMSRQTIDEMCLLAMPEAGGMSAIKRGTIYESVRLAGWACFKPKPPMPVDVKKG
jgi:hypothetical protein